MFRKMIDSIRNSFASPEKRLEMKSSVFTTAGDSKKARKIMRLKDKALVTADKKLHAFNDTFLRAKMEFICLAKQFVKSFKELESTMSRQS